MLLLPLTGQAEMDKKSAVVRMSVGKYAKITGLNDFILNTQNEDGSAEALYAGSDEFNLESNCAVQVDLVGEPLSKGEAKLKTSYQLDEKDMTFSTAAGVHNAPHKVSAQAQLGNISSQESGDYSANITLTVSAIQ